MCDTLVAKDHTTGEWYFAKNSDRDIDEPQVIQYCDPQEGLTTPTHVEQRSYYNNNQYPTLLKASEGLSLTHRALICRPAWIWGAEMGINERGVAIGNEAVFARRGSSKRGLLGMDILRLTLHVAATAKEALETIVSLLEKWGQGGNGSYSGKLHYHNSFLIADGKEAYILESVNQRWVARQIEDIASISNAYTIANEYTMGDKETLIKRPNFKRTYASRLHLPFTQGNHRQQLPTTSPKRGGPAGRVCSQSCATMRGVLPTLTTRCAQSAWMPKD